MDYGILIGMFMSAIVAFIIGGFYGITPSAYLFVVLIALGLFIQAIIYVLKYKDPEEVDTHK